MLHVLYRDRCKLEGLYKNDNVKVLINEEVCFAHSFQVCHCELVLTHMSLSLQCLEHEVITSWSESLRGYHFHRKRGPKFRKMSASIKLQPPLFRQQKFYDPHCTGTTPIHLTPKQSKTVLKSVFLNKINTLSVVYIL